MPETPPEAPQAPAAPAPATPLEPAQPTPEKTPPWGADENFDPAKAWELIQNLRKEKADPAIAQRLAEIEQKHESQKQAIAQALGLSEPPKSENDLAETVKSIQQALADQQLKSTRLEVAAEHQIPAEYHDLLTETDTEKLKAQAAKIATLVAAQNAAAGTPAHLPIPGQGAGGNASPEAEAEALYRQFYPNSNR